MKPYNWHEAATNGLLVFLACFTAKFPILAACMASAAACESMTMPNGADLKHALITCGTVLVAVEIRYVYRYLQQFADYPDSTIKK